MDGVYPDAVVAECRESEFRTGGGLVEVHDVQVEFECACGCSGEFLRIDFVESPQRFAAHGKRDFPDEFHVRICGRR